MNICMVLLLPNASIFSFKFDKNYWPDLIEWNARYSNKCGWKSSHSQNEEHTLTLRHPFKVKSFLIKDNFSRNWMIRVIDRKDFSQDWKKDHLEFIFVERMFYHCFVLSTKDSSSYKRKCRIEYRTLRDLNLFDVQFS